jgi:hypothetical protein
MHGADLHGANLEGAGLRGANLEGADLRGANLDFSCWPLWCGSLGVKGDAALVGQLAYHLFDLIKGSGVEVKSLKKLRDLANNSSPVTVYFKERI